MFPRAEGSKKKIFCRFFAKQNFFSIFALIKTNLKILKNNEQEEKEKRCS